MNPQFISLYLDEDVDVLIADLVKAYGFEATTTRQAEQLGKSDEDQLTYAVDNGMTLLTHNRVHFERLATTYFNQGKDHRGIIIAVQRSPYEITQRLLKILNHLKPDEMKNQLRYI